MSKRLVTISSHPPKFWGVLLGVNGLYGGPEMPEIQVHDNKASGTGWDFLVDVADTTGDGNAPLIQLNSIGGTPGQTFTLKYLPPFTPITTIVSIRTLKLTFTSGHIEYFEIPMTIKAHHDGLNSPWFIMDLVELANQPGSSSESYFQQGYYNTHLNAAIDPATGLPVNNFYSLQSQNKGVAGSLTVSGLLVTEPFYIFSKYSGVHANTIGVNTNPGFTPSEQFLHVKSDVNNVLYDHGFCGSGGTISGHDDRLAHIYGLNALTTPDAGNPNRQEFHSIDFLLQENNPLWYDNLETQGGVLMNVPNIINQMNSNLGFMQGTYSGDNWPVPPYGSVEPSPIDPGIDIRNLYRRSEVWDSFGDNIMTWNSAYELATRGADTSNSPHYHYVYKIFYAENLTAPAPPNPLHVFNVCDEAGDPSYYLTTSKDCSGATIPAANLPGGANHNITTFVPNNACCSNCTLEIVSTTPHCGTYGVNDKIIEVTTTNPAWTSTTTTGNPWSSGSQYTYNLTLSNGNSLTQTMPPTGGNTVTQANCVTNTTSGTEHEVTCPSSSTITPWMQVSGAGIPAGTYVGNILTGTAGNNVTKFTLIDAVGNTVQATAAATVTLTFAAGFRFYFGSLAPNEGALLGTYYILKVTDEDGCEKTLHITLADCAVPDGCTDNTAINYDASAVNDDGSCVVCNATTGKLEDPAGNIAGDLFTNHVALVTDATVNASNVPQSDGTVSLTTSIDPALQQYISLGATETYTMGIYPVTVPGDPSTIGSVISQQTGIASNTFSYSPQHTFTGLGFGHYAIKIQFVDSNNVLEAEECFTWVYITVKVPVCDDVNSSDYNTTVAAPFRIPDSSLCTPSNCPVPSDHSFELSDDPNYWFTNCNGGGGQNSNGANECNPYLHWHFALYDSPGCGPGTIGPGHFGPGYFTVVWLFNGVAHPNQNSSGTANDISGYGVGHTSPINANGVGFGHSQLMVFDPFWNSMSPLQVLGAGTYTQEVYVDMPDGSICVYTQDFVFDGVPDSGCPDPAALNYNPNALCPGPCIYESWECDLVTGSCYDPGDGTGQYSSLVDCEQSCVPMPIPGCTDPCAINYDPAADTDDGTCEYKACLDSGASNYEYSCDCGIDIPSATVHDPDCCEFPCDSPPDITVTTTDSTGTCTGPIADGTVTFKYASTNGSTHFLIQIYSGLPVSANLIYSYVPDVSPTPAPDGSTITHSGLAPGAYTITFTDLFGCKVEQTFSISTTTLSVGCTDPLASNYDPNASCDDGSCIYEGCTDPLAINYNPNAIIDDGSCLYRDEKNPCIPKQLKKAIVKLKSCLSQKGSEWLTEYKIGTNIDCSTMNKWKLILLGYVLKSNKSENGFGLGCLFNCADKGTPNIEDVALNCNDLWVKGGSFTGLNDAATNGASVTGTSWTTGEGTTVTDPALYFTSPHKLSLGDVIKMPSGYIYRVVSISFNQVGPLTFDLKDNNPETATGIAGGNWTKCSDENFIDITTSVNYYDNFLKFVNKYCKDCNIPPAWKQK
tara:strand:+ start:4247 stop:8782 length:4536 start_codon:yes stop_codon:yes gene_type:complete